MGTLYVVATPIGNLKDVTLRALEVLRDAELILAEDTRVTKKLLSRFKILKPVIRYDEYASDKVYSAIALKLKNGQKIALVTDAGTPGIADPGAKLISFIRQELPAAEIIPIPGSSALTAVLSVSGIRADRFTFLGYPPHKKGRQTFFKVLKEIETRPIVFYESPHRVEKTLRTLREFFGPSYKIIVGRELTKVHEEIWQGGIAEAENHFQAEKRKGEFVMIIP